MRKCIITTKSQTLAKKAERALLKVGIGARVTSVDPSLTERGCGWGVELPCADVTPAEEALRRDRIYFGVTLGGGI